MLSLKRYRRSLKAITAAAGAAVLLGAPISRACADGQPWIKSSVVYCLYPTIFSPSGDLPGAMRGLKRLKDIGVNVVWLMPVTPIGHAVDGHPAFDSPYCVQDYNSVNPQYGTGEDLRRLVAAAHRLHMKVILDEVLNHSAWDNPLITEHPEYYVHTDANIHDPHSIDHAFTYNDVAQFDYSNPDLRAYMVGMLLKWMKTYNLDGFRFDSADNPSGPRRLIPADFWQDAGKKLHEVKPDVLMIGESGVPELADHPFQIQYGWIMYDGLKRAIQNSDAGAARDAWDYQNRQTPTYLAMQDNWDKQRDVNTFGGPEGAMAAAVFNQTGNGVPLIYNGMEIGNAAGDVNPHGKIDWTRPNPAFPALYRQLAELRSRYAPLREGSMTWVSNTAPAQVLTYTRTSRHSEVLIEINISDKTAAGSVTLPAGPAWTDVTPRGPWPSPVRNGSDFVLQPRGFAIYRRELR